MSHSVSQSVAKAAIYYTQILDLKIFPLHDVASGICSCELGDKCGPRAGKHPRIKRWQTEASKDPRKIAKWWNIWPDANIGIPTGRDNGLVVIDIDPATGGWLSYEDHLKFKIPTTYTPTTGGGGQHIWLRYPEDLEYELTNRNQFPQGIDVRANGGYVVAAPSKTLKGPYPWSEAGIPVSIDELAVIPRVICDEYLKPADGEPNLVNAADVKTYKTLSATEKKRINKYVKAALEADLKELETLQFRAEWDNETFRLACKILELAKAPWSPLTLEQATKAIWEHVPKPDGQGWTRERINKKIESAWKRINSTDLVRPYPTGEPPTGDKEWEAPEPRFRFTPASAYKPKPVEWLWDRRIPKGSLSLLAGREDVGKSFVSLTLAADLTHGRVEGCWHGRPKNVLYVATEDSWSHTIVPRLMAAGADLNRVYNLELTDDDAETELPIVLQRDLKHLEDYIISDDVGLIILDPIISSLGDVNTYKASEVRKAFDSIVKVAERTGCSILGVIHFNKTNNTDVLNAISESKAFTQVARSVLVAVKDSDNEDRRLLSVVKSNLGQKPKTLVYEIRNTIVASSINIGKLWWLGETDQTAEEAHQQNVNGQHDTAREDCEYFIKQMLLTWNGEVESNIVFERGGKEGWSKDQLKRTKSRLRIGSKRIGDTWFWSIEPETLEQYRNELMM